MRKKAELRQAESTRKTREAKDSRQKFQKLANYIELGGIKEWGDEASFNKRQKAKKGIWQTNHSPKFIVNFEVRFNPRPLNMAAKENNDASQFDWFTNQVF